MQYENLSASEVKSFIAQAGCVVLDHRDPQNYRSAHLPGAMLVNDALIMQLISKQKDAPVLVYCYHGNSSRDLASLLVNFGMRYVYNLDGGWQAWEQFQSSTKAHLSPRLQHWLVDYGFDPENLNSRIKNGMTPVMQAALLAEQDYLLELVKAGADLNLVNHDGNNALWFAAFSECIECIEALIQHGIRLNNCNDNGATCLIYAASAGKLKVVQALVNAGANLHQSTLDGFNALDSASTLEILKFLRPQYIAA